MEADKRLDYAVLISFATYEEAHVAAAALRADGVDAFVGNSNFAAANWFYTLAMNGLQILVPRQRLVEAKTLLRERIRDNADPVPEDCAYRKDRWKLWLIGAWLYGPIALAWLEYFLAPDGWQFFIPDTTWMIREANF